MTDKKDWGLTVRGLVKKDNKILILRRHPKSRNNPHKWELPGGKVDPGEFFDTALIREFKEETDLEVQISDEHDDFKWVSVKDLKELYNEDMLTPTLKKTLEKRDFEI